MMYHTPACIIYYKIVILISPYPFPQGRGIFQRVKGTYLYYHMNQYTKFKTPNYYSCWDMSHAAGQTDGCNYWNGKTIVPNNSVLKYVCDGAIIYINIKLSFECCELMMIVERVESFKYFYYGSYVILRTWRNGRKKR